MTWRWLNWFSLGALGAWRIPHHNLPKPYVLLQLGAAFEEAT